MNNTGNSALLKKTVLATSVLGAFALGVRLLWVPVSPVYWGTDMKKWLLYSSVSAHIHAISACIFVVLALSAFLSKKGGESHRIFGKIGVLAFILCLLFAGILLTYLAIATGLGPNISPTMPNSAVQVGENISVLLVFLIGGFYGIATGYRWSVLSQPRLDLDWIFGILAWVVSIFSLVLVPFVGFFFPIVKISLERNVGTPASAVVLLTALSGLFAYFGYDDLRTYYCNKGVPFRVRVEKHIYRIMVATGLALNAIFLVHLGKATASGLGWTLYLAPAIIIMLLTFYLKKNYLEGIEKKGLL
jgi:hypothetical protein